MLLEYKGWSKPVLGTARVWRQGRVVATSAQPARPSQDPPAPGTGPAGGVPSPLALVLSPPLALCHLGLAAGSAASWGLAPELDQSLSQVGSPMLGCPCQSCSSPSGVLPMSRSLLFPFLSTSCFPQNPSPRRLWRSPFPPGGRRQLRVHGSKWSH